MHTQATPLTTARSTLLFVTLAALVAVTTSCASANSYVNTPVTTWATEASNYERSKCDVGTSRRVLEALQQADYKERVILDERLCAAAAEYNNRMVSGAGRPNFNELYNILEVVGSLDTNVQIVTHTNPYHYHVMPEMQVNGIVSKMVAIKATAFGIAYYDEGYNNRKRYAIFFVDRKLWLDDMPLVVGDKTSLDIKGKTDVAGELRIAVSAPEGKPETYTLNMPKPGDFAQTVKLPDAKEVYIDFTIDPLTETEAVPHVLGNFRVLRAPEPLTPDNTARAEYLGAIGASEKAVKAAEAVVERLNADRKARGLAPLEVSSKLAAAALKSAADATLTVKSMLSGLDIRHDALNFYNDSWTVLPDIANDPWLPNFPGLRAITLADDAKRVGVGFASVEGQWHYTVIVETAKGDKPASMPDVKLQDAPAPASPATPAPSADDAAAPAAL